MPPGGFRWPGECIGGGRRAVRCAEVSGASAVLQPGFLWEQHRGVGPGRFPPFGPGICGPLGRGRSLFHPGYSPAGGADGGARTPDLLHGGVFSPRCGAAGAASCRYPVRLLAPEQFQELYVPAWSNALCEKRRELDVLAVGAYDGGKLIGLAGCSADCEEMWQIGIDVLPDYRRQGVASALTSRLAAEILQRGKVPFYCAAWSNLAVGAQRFAQRLPPRLGGDDRQAHRACRGNAGIKETGTACGCSRFRYE